MISLLKQFLFSCTVNTYISSCWKGTRTYKGCQNYNTTNVQPHINNLTILYGKASLVCSTSIFSRENWPRLFGVCRNLFLFFFTQKTHKINKACTPYNFIVITECMLVNLKHLKLLRVAGTATFTFLHPKWWGCLKGEDETSKGWN